jgi:transcriptional regulator with PAS, ATPase and Fis domain
MPSTSALPSVELPSRAPRLRALARVPAHPPFVAVSAAARTLLERADRLAVTNVPLLISGESGTGKEVLARRIHARSRRAAGPFVAENCAAISSGLFESELFGHARGAFTGADRDRDGLFQRASGGTLLLDEVGDLPLALQAKLLRALEEGVVRPVGSTHPVPVDVRVLSATNLDLTEAVRSGRFREDLFYRLQGARLEIPPLRERPEDASALAHHFLDGLNRDHGTARRLLPSQLRRITRHPWYGNARELRNAVHLAYHAADGEHLELDGALRTDAPTRPATEERLVTRVAQLAEIERDAILLALEQCGGNREEAARRLGISRSSIYERIRRHGLDGVGRRVKAV